MDHARGLVLVLVIKLMDRFSRKNILVSLTKIGFGVFYLARIVFCDSHAWFYPRWILNYSNKFYFYSFAPMLFNKICFFETLRSKQPLQNGESKKKKNQSIYSHWWIADKFCRVDTLNRRVRWAKQNHTNLSPKNFGRLRWLHNIQRRLVVRKITKRI